MADNLMFPFSGRVILDSNGDPVSGAKLEVFDAGTTNQQTVYTNAALTVAGVNPIEANSNGVVPLRYLGTSDWKLTFKDSSDVTLGNYDTLDNVPGAVDTSPFLIGTVAPSRASFSKTGAYTTVNATDNGKQINCDATGGDFTITLDAATVGDGKDYVIKNTGENGVVTVDRGGGTDDVVLAPLDSATFRSDGATWQTVEAYNATDNLVTVAFSASITLDLVYPAGANYQITATGDFTLANPTSVRPGTFFTVTIIQDATGGRDVTFGSYFQNKPSVDVAASAVTVIGFHARTATVFDAWTLSGGVSGWDYVCYNQQAQNTAGGTTTLGSWRDIPLNNADRDRFGLGNPASSLVPVPPGIWEAEWFAPFFASGNTQTRLYDNTGAAEIAVGTVVEANVGVGSDVSSTGYAYFTLNAASNISLQYQCSITQATVGLGQLANYGVERYAWLRLRKVASL